MSLSVKAELEEMEDEAKYLEKKGKEVRYNLKLLWG